MLGSKGSVKRARSNMQNLPRNAGGEIHPLSRGKTKHLTLDSLGIAPVDLALIIPRREGLRHSGGGGELMVLEESDGEAREKMLGSPRSCR